VFSTFVAPFLYDDAASKIALAVAVGLLVGLEREWAQKAVGVRTFAIIALLEAFTYLVAPGLLIDAFCGTSLLVILMNIHNLLKDWRLATDGPAIPRTAACESAYVVDRDAPLEIKTSVVLLVTLMLGALIGQGHYFTAITSAMVMTILLSWKEGGAEPYTCRRLIQRLRFQASTIRRGSAVRPTVGLVFPAAGIPIIG
jgi:hypothetical protein